MTFDLIITASKSAVHKHVNILLHFAVRKLSTTNMQHAKQLAVVDSSSSFTLYAEGCICQPDVSGSLYVNITNKGTIILLKMRMTSMTLLKIRTQTLEERLSNPAVYIYS